MPHQRLSLNNAPFTFFTMHKNASSILALLATLSLAHILRAWHQHYNRISGGSMMASLMWLSLTEYLLHYFSDETII